jgi:hypothetical protein
MTINIQQQRTHSSRLHDCNHFSSHLEHSRPPVTSPVGLHSLHPQPPCQLLPGIIVFAYRSTQLVEMTGTKSTLAGTNIDIFIFLALHHTMNILQFDPKLSTATVNAGYQDQIIMLGRCIFISTFFVCNGSLQAATGLRVVDTRISRNSFLSHH